MTIQNMLDEQNILFDSTINNKEELFESLTQSLVASGYVKNGKKFMKDLYAREKLTSTGIEDGFGIPHTKSKAVTKATIAFAHVGEMKDYVGLDEQPINTVFMLAVPKDSNDTHLELLSSLARRLMDDTFKLKIKQAQTKTDIYNAFEE